MRTSFHPFNTTLALSAIACLSLTSAASAQWVTYSKQTTTRMPTGAGLNTPATSTADPEEKDYAWGDVNNDGWVDLVSARKVPFTFAGGKSNVLFMNENGVLIDRTNQYASTSINVPQSELTYAANMNPPQAGTTQGFLDLTNDRDILLVDLNNDGWLDMVTATTIGDVNNSGAPYMLPRFLGHPRVYINKGEIGGVWQGFVYDYNRIPQLFSINGVATHPRFCSVGAGDVNKDGLIDLYFGDYDSAEVGPDEPGGSDFDNKLLINNGLILGTPVGVGYFADESTARMGAIFNYPSGVGNRNLLYTTFGAASLIADMNGDGLKDVVKQTSLTPPQHVATITNPVGNPGVWVSTNYKIQYSLSSYFVSAGDLNNDGHLDLVHSDDGAEVYQLRTGNDGNGNPTYSNFTLGGFNDGFASNSIISDLNNDGWNDVMVCDVDVDGFGCARRLHIGRNQGNAPNVTISDSTPGGMVNSDLQGTHDLAVFDIDRDGWKDFVIGRCNTTEVWMNVAPARLAFSYPQGLPTTLTPNQPTNFQVQLTGVNGGTPLANSAKLWVSVGGAAFTQLRTSSLGGNLYQVTIPTQTCAASVRFYLSGQLSTAATFTDPAPNINSTVPASYYAATAAASSQTVMNETFESGPGSWTIANDGGLSNGGWQLAVPNGTYNEGVLAAPALDNTTVGTQCYITGNAAAGSSPYLNNVDGGSTHLVSPTIDLAGVNAQISFAYWFYTSTPGPVTGGGGTGGPAPGDVLTVSVSSDNGANWTVVGTYKGPRLAEPNLTPGDANTWKTASFNVGDFVAPTAQVKVRFSANDVAPAGVVEAGIDDVVIRKAVCKAAPCPADITNDSVINVNDLLAVINGWGPCGGCPADITDDGQVNVNDLLAVINAWGACP